MDIITISTIILNVIGGATVVLNIIAPLTKTKKDDKVLTFLKKLLSFISLNVPNKKLGYEDNQLKIDIKLKK